MTDFVLVSHPDFPGTAIRSITVEATRTGDGALKLEYCVTGAIDQVRWPEWKGVRQADRLWEHSCFEAFVGMVDEGGYIELNFSTSGEWAAYRFAAYRAEMQAIEGGLATGGRTFSDGEMRVRRTVRLSDFADGDWRLGLSAIIEEVDGGKSYWALAHPPGKPDFHAAICFAGRLAAPAGE
ncbi:MAG TPA: hypothetical protein VF404_00840 [Sphingomonas sp.]